MKLAYFAAGILAGFVASTAAVVTAWQIDLTHHDALGRTHHATATLNSPSTLIGYTLFVDYTSDQIFCSALGGQ